MSDEPTRNELLEAAGGQPLTALQLHESDGLATQQAWTQGLGQLFSQRVSALKLAEQWLDYDLKEVLIWLQSKVSAMIKYKMTGEGLPERWNPVLAPVAVKGLYAFLDEVSESLANVQRGNNPNKQLLLESLLIQASNLSRTNVV